MMKTIIVLAAFYLLVLTGHKDLHGDTMATTDQLKEYEIVMSARCGIDHSSNEITDFDKPAVTSESYVSSQGDSSNDNQTCTPDKSYTAVFIYL